jgi:hypothetical protein
MQKEMFAQKIVRMLSPAIRHNVQVVVMEYFLVLEESLQGISMLREQEQHEDLLERDEGSNYFGTSFLLMLDSQVLVPWLWL